MAVKKEPNKKIEKREQSKQARRKVKVGRVTSDAMEKTIVVATDILTKHPIYKKTVRKTVKYKAHDEKNDANKGDLVEIIETRPLSKQKRWRLTKVIERAK